MRPIGSIYEFDAIGSRFWLERLDGGEFSTDLTKQIDAYVAAFDRLYSRFRDDSLVSKLFFTGRIVQPPTEMIEMLDFARKMYTASDGVFNLTVAGTLSDLGYGLSAYTAAVDDDLWGHISYSSDEIVANKGTMLDFGGFGKGWLIDRLAAMLRQNGVKQYIVNGGGDLYVESLTPIEFALEDPLHPDTVWKTASIAKGALAGSNTLKRAWESRKGRKHHIIDPVMADSSDSGVVASYVLADTALIADTLATIVIIRPELTEKLERQFHTRIMLI